MTAAQDKTIQETADLLGIGFETVKIYRNIVLQKLSCHAIAGGIDDGGRIRITD